MKVGVIGLGYVGLPLAVNFAEAGCEVVGVDVATERVETPEEVAETIRAASRHVAPERIFPCTTCGMAPIARDLALAKLEALAQGAALARGEPRRR